MSSRIGRTLATLTALSIAALIGMQFKMVLATEWAAWQLSSSL